MPLSAGDILGPYEILGPLGAGGMGEVYRARDPRLNRDVAIKVSHEQFSDRFEREARAVAALNHPNICTLYDVGPNYLVMELIEGESPKGPMALEEALCIARQIADALEAAHEKGIVHRDLKPGNIKIRPDGTVKVLDFGLAKATEENSSVASQSPTMSPTLSLAMTQMGVILGTAAYMSPEQARGRPVDKRADIWAFGVVLYEMLTGRQTFMGETITDVLASVVKEEPRWDDVPVKVRRLLIKCLEKDPKRRLRDIGDAWELLDDDAPAQATAALRRPWLAWGAAAMFLLGFLFIAIAHFRELPPARLDLMRLQIPLLAGSESVIAFTLSPDGRHLAYFDRGSDGVPRVWLRSLDSLEARPLTGTENVATVPIFWSSDSRFVVFLIGGRLKKIPIAGGPPEILADNTGEIGGSWNQDGVIIIGTNPGVKGGSLMRISANGTVTPLTVVERRKEVAHHHPTFLPDGKHFLYLRVATLPENSGIYVGSLDTPAAEQSTKRLVATAFGPAQFIPSTDSAGGYLLFMRDGTLLAQPFNDRTFELSGEPTAVAGPVGSFIDRALFSAGANGTLVYKQSSATDLRLSWLERRGSQVLPGATVGSARDFYSGGASVAAALSGFALSPDGKRLAVVRRDPQRAENTNVWLFDLVRGAASPFTYGPAVERSPVWSPDGSRIVFSSSRNSPFDLYVKPTDGSKDEELLLKSGENKIPTSWSRDGHFLLYTQIDPETGSDIWVLSDPGAAQADHKPVPFLRTEFAEAEAQFSPEASGAPRWIAYVSNESGRNEVYVRPFADLSSGAPPGGKWLVSRGGGTNPRWRSDGRELTYVAGTKIYAVDVSASAAFQAGAPKLLAELPEGTVHDDITADGSRILIVAAEKQNASAPFAVVLNWQAGLKK